MNGIKVQLQFSNNSAKGCVNGTSFYDLFVFNNNNKNITKLIELKSVCVIKFKK